MAELFPNGKMRIIKKPINQAQNYKGYTWARLYPKDSDKDFLAFTIGVESSGFIVKIDTVNSSGQLREAYEQLRGDFYKSNIVKIKSLLKMHLKSRNILKMQYMRSLKSRCIYVSIN